MQKEKIFNYIPGILFFGSLWGLSEASFGGWLYSRGIPHASIYLSAVALIILAASKYFFKLRWTGALTGFVAMFFKLVNVPFFACHLLAILLLGIGFDIACELVTRFYSGKFKLPLIGLAGTYVGRSLFALSITYIFRYHYWTEVGFPKVIDYIFISGSAAAFIGVIAVPFGNHLGKRISKLSWQKLHPRLTTIAVLAATLGIWIIQQAI